MGVIETNRHAWTVAEESTRIEALRRSLTDTRNEVLAHQIYGKLETIGDLITFAEFHVFAVWDFMSLLKSLQRKFTCVDLPWVPRPSSLACRLVNEIVLGEESDTVDDGYMSHFDLYLGAMSDLGADIGPITRFIGLLDEDMDVDQALIMSGAPAAAAGFVRNTWDVVTHMADHEIAAAFALSREDLIPKMFERVLAAEGIGSDRVARFVSYLDRHIHLDAEEHTPMAMQLLLELCGDDDLRWQECSEIAVRCLDSRARLWSGVCEEIDRRRPAEPAPQRVHASLSSLLGMLELPEPCSSEGVEVTVEGNIVFISAASGPDSRPYRAQFVLPEGVRAESVSATMSNGVLMLRSQHGERRNAVPVPVTNF